MTRKPKKWSQHVLEVSNAMDLPEGIFTLPARDIARELKKAVLASDRTKGTKFQSAMSMLNYYINRAGKNLNAADKKRLEQAEEAVHGVLADLDVAAAPELRTQSEDLKFVDDRK